FLRYRPHRDLHSFPTRRSSDLEEWEPEELKLLDRLLVCVVNEGKLYEGLDASERYYLTQLLVDLFDEFVDSEAVTDEMSHQTLVDRKSTRLNSSHRTISYAVFC